MGPLSSPLPLKRGCSRLRDHFCAGPAGLPALPSGWRPNLSLASRSGDSSSSPDIGSGPPGPSPGASQPDAHLRPFSDARVAAAVGPRPWSAGGCPSVCVILTVACGSISFVSTGPYFLWPGAVGAGPGGVSVWRLLHAPRFVRGGEEGGRVVGRKFTRYLMELTWATGATHREMQYHRGSWLRLYQNEEEFD